MEEIHPRLNDQQSGEFRLRIKVLFFVILLALSIFIVRLAYLQIIRGDEFRQKSESNSIRLRKIRPPRGLVMDSNRQVMVENQPSFDILFAPNRISDIPQVMRKFKDLYAEKSFGFSMDLSLAEKARSFAPIRLERNASWEKVAVVETNSLDLPGVFVEASPIRQYHEGEMISHIVGYTGEITEQELAKDIPDNHSAGDFVGKDGIERYLDDYLRGKNGVEHFEDKFEYVNKSDSGIPIKISEDGTRLYISIKKIANTKDNAKIAIDMMEYIKTLIIALA